MNRAFPNQRYDSDLLIGPGPEYIVISAYGFPGRSLHVDYVLKSPGGVDVYVLTADEYVVFAHFMYPSGSLYAEVNRSAGDFTFTFPAMAPYYITFARHITPVTGDPLLLHLTVVATGVNALALAGGVGMLSAAVVLVIVARRWRRDARRAVWASPGIALVGTLTR